MLKSELKSCLKSEIRNPKQFFSGYFRKIRKFISRDLLVQLGLLDSRNEVAPTCPTQRVAWHKLSGEHVYLCFTLPVQEFLSRTSLLSPLASLLSPLAFQDHPALIDNTLATVTLFLCSTAFKSVLARSHSSGTIPKWTSELSNAHKVSQDAHRAWVAAGRPRDINNPFCQIINLQRLPLEPCFAPIAMVNVTISMLL